MRKIKRFSGLLFFFAAASFAGCGSIYSDAFNGGGAFYVTFNANGNTGGSVPADTLLEKGTAFTVPGNTGNLINIPAAGTGEAHKFGGWNTQADGNGTTYLPGQTITMGSTPITLYVKWIAFALRDTGPAGGLIFYDKGSYDNGPVGGASIPWRYMEAAPLSTERTAPWGASGRGVNGSTDTSIGSGQTNTTNITADLDNNSETGKAAQLCKAVNFGGYFDWFLPSQGELSSMYKNLKSGMDQNNVSYVSIGGFIPSPYWSSSEAAAYILYADSVSFSDGNVSSTAKTTTCSVRAARMF